MHIDYEISEKDYLDGQRLAVKGSLVRMIRWTPLVIPAFGALLALFLIYGALTQGASVKFVPGAIFSLLFLSIPFLSRHRQKTSYANSNSLHGNLALDIDDSGIQFGGPVTSARVDWAYFNKFLEDDRTFVLYAKNQSVFNIVPKRALSRAQVVRFRQYLEQNVRSSGSRDIG